MALVKFTGVNPDELKKLETAMKEEAFVDELATKSNPAEVKDALTQKGIHFTLEEVERIRDTLKNAENTSDSLSEEDLENVSGGGSWFTLVDISWKTKKGTTITIHIPW